MTVQKKIGTVMLLVAVLAAVCASAFIGARLGASAPDPLTRILFEADGSDGSTVRTISIPGFKELKLKADQTEQNVYFYNPEQNDCYFVVALIVDNVTYYTSERLSPGTELTSITLTQAIPAGAYERAILRYSCYDMSDSTKELNGADVIVKLEVE